MIGVGLDCGSTWTKGAAVSDDGRVLALEVAPSGWDLKAAGLGLLSRLKTDLGEPSPKIAATGYGRARLDEALAVITEISAHALGAEKLRPGVRAVIDVGGQDTKIITVDGGRPVEFVMNDKCAAGAGRFLDMILKRLELGHEALDALPEPAVPVRLNSVCAVFAESEILSLLASGRSRAEALCGAVGALAERTAALAGRLALSTPIVMTGGLSACQRFTRRLQEALKLPVEPLESGFYAGAIGAALTALKQPD